MFRAKRRQHLAENGPHVSRRGSLVKVLTNHPTTGVGVYLVQHRFTSMAEDVIFARPYCVLYIDVGKTRKSVESRAFLHENPLSFNRAIASADPVRPSPQERQKHHDQSRTRTSPGNPRRDVWLAPLRSVSGRAWLGH